MSNYIYDPSTEEERKRLNALETVLDADTFRVLERIGVSEGWRCLEVGGGGGSVTRWLTERVGPEGSVVATDLSPRFLEEIDAPNLEVRKHNVATDPLEENAFDLVHSRDVLEHIPEREAVLDKMVAALKPGGWLVAEDVDFVGALRAEGFGEDSELTPFEGQMWTGMVRSMKARGVDAEYGRRLPWRLKARGLEDIDAIVRGGLAKAGSPGATLAALSTKQLRPLLVEGGMSDADVDRLRENLQSDEFMGFGPLQVAAWGRKPA
jgi:2-polyprenyl-3-methyl-5-hydroxy-6-metoxy-1,4-benzoquinol methylase